uniref:Bromo domain-containing protein n=1 Tax=Parastrongyloides trichosuri TaxID=131310 RepID=A0A0N4ZMH1_PARTI
MDSQELENSTNVSEDNSQEIKVEDVPSTPQVIKKRGRPPLDPSLKKSGKRKSVSTIPRNDKGDMSELPTEETDNGSDNNMIKQEFEGTGISSSKRERKKTKRAETPDSMVPNNTKKRKNSEKRERKDKDKEEKKFKTPTTIFEENGVKTNNVITETLPVVNKKPNYKSYSPFQLFCNHILRKLAAKDPEEYFAYPVSPADAPEYDKIITNPMDFLTIRGKIENGDYKTIKDMEYDVNLIAENAMIYNAPTTIYYFAAIKLQGIAKYYFSEKYLEYLRISLPFGRQVSHEEAGLQPPKKYPIIAPRNKLSQQLRQSIYDDDMVKRFSDLSNGNTKLTMEVPKLKGKLAFLDNKNGATVLNVLGDEHGGKSSYTIGDLVGKLERGTPGLLSNYEPIVLAKTPVGYFDYGPFTTFAPQYDSTWASMTKKDSDMFYNCYGSRENTGFAFQMMNTIKDCDDSYIKIVNDMLDDITNGEHSKAMEEFKNVDNDDSDEEEISKYDVYKNVPDDKLLDNILTLENVGVDCGMLKELKDLIGVKPYVYSTPEDLQRQGNLYLNDLNYLQNQRLSLKPPVTLSHGITPSQAEINLAEKVVDNLNTQINEYAKPQDLVQPQAIHNALSIDDDGMDIFNEFFTL